MTQVDDAVSRRADRLWRLRRMRMRHRRRRRLPPISVIPTLCTLGNLVAGFAAIHYAAREPNVRLLWHDWTPLTLAGALVFLGMLLDAIDGSLARLTRSTSEIGSQLDSLADVVTFGVAPAFMTLQLVANHLKGEWWIIGPEADSIFGKIIWSAAAAYVVCAALRLARFNVEMGPGTVNDHSLFRGLPSPGAAGTVASLVILHQHLLVKFANAAAAGTPVISGVTTPEGVPMGFVQWSALGIPLIMLLCAVGMVSNIPYVHFANRYFRGPRNFAYLVRVVAILVLAITAFQYVIAVGFTIYALSGPVRLLWSRFRRRRTVVADGG
jgi:CDP-diacylglycerol--serine O-phosphatidyltransferase